MLLGATAIAEGALALLIAAQRRTAETLFWAGAAVGVLALLAGAAPGFWTLPLVSKVQFPWRAMALEEFALVTLLGLAPALTARRMALAGAAMVLANPALSLTAGQLLRPAVALRVAALPAEPLYTPEYLPAGMLRTVRGMPVPQVGFDALRRLPLVSGAGASAQANPVTGALAIRLPPGPAQTLVARRFYFPSWGASCDGRPVAVHAAGPARLVAIDAPAGASACTLSIGLTPPERLGWALSLAGLLLICAWLAWSLVPRVAVATRRQPRAAAVLAGRG